MNREELRQEIVASAYGIPTPFTGVEQVPKRVASTDLDFSGINGRNNNSFLPNNMSDSDFDNLITKKGRQKAKQGLQNLGNKAKNLGQNIGDKAQNLGQNLKGKAQNVAQNLKGKAQNLKGKVGSKLDNVKDKLQNIGDKVGDGFKKVGRVLAVGTLAIPRQSARALIAVNFRGFATRIMDSGGINNKQLIDKWKKLGGTPDKLIQSAKTGQNKKPLICGQKCKETLLAESKKSNFSGFSGNIPFEVTQMRYKQALDQLQFSNMEPATTGILITTGGGILTGLISAIPKIGQNKALKQQIEAEEKIAQQELEQRARELGVSEQALQSQYDLAQQQLQAESNPVLLIQNNPDLTPEEKAEATKQLQDALAEEDTRKFGKFALYGGIGLVALLIGYRVFKSK